ncbi:hypothetical protein EVAR_11474_1 [Eumeta japonica]|uniref:Uncharacterized protein n=1 Tax=Eumeta variegata TaxID=151549 RepID=A0A4C1TN51_EUMVA|nr:hypothetical protein EVAR_11474_1 [Eumeta japonica]
MIGFQGLMIEPEGKHRNSILKQRILGVFDLVEIVLRCTLTMNDFQGLLMQLEGRHQYCITEKRIQAVFAVVGIGLGYVISLWNSYGYLLAPSSDQSNYTILL